MKLTLLGTGTPAPSLKRMSSGYVIETGDDVIVMDHGPGAHHRLLEAGYKPTDVTHCFLTHLHYDHFMDFPRLLMTRWDQGSGKVPELQVFGPKHQESETGNCPCVASAHAGISDSAIARARKYNVRYRIHRVRAVLPGPDF